jgi:hypothetical protein
VDINYTPDGVAQVAECTYQGRRLIVRRTRLTGVICQPHGTTPLPEAWDHLVITTAGECA